MKQNEVIEVKNILEYLQDKVESCYKKETQQAINDFMKDIKND